jgi:hypothetical protein
MLSVGAIYGKRQTAAAPIGRACDTSAQKLLSGLSLTPAGNLEEPLRGIQ